MQGTHDELELLIHSEQESRNVEFKVSFAWGKRQPRADLRAKVIRTILAMANTPDGGAIVIGKGNDGSLLGVQPPHLTTWTQDAVCEGANDHASPSVSVTVSKRTVDGKAFVVVQVAPFDAIPVACCKQLMVRDPTTQKDVCCLLKGGLYARSLHKIESALVASAEEMRDILDRALESARRRWVESNLRAGLIRFPTQEPTDADRFAAELGEI